MERNTVERVVTTERETKSRIKRSGVARLVFVKRHKPQHPQHVKVSPRELFSVEKLATSSKGHHAIEHFEKETRRKTQWSAIYIQSAAGGTTANRTSELLLPVQNQVYLGHGVKHTWTFPNTYTVS